MSGNWDSKPWCYRQILPNAGHLLQQAKPHEMGPGGGGGGKTGQGRQHRERLYRQENRGPGGLPIGKSAKSDDRGDEVYPPRRHPSTRRAERMKALCDGGSAAVARQRTGLVEQAHMTRPSPCRATAGGPAPPGVSARCATSGRPDIIDCFRGPRDVQRGGPGHGKQETRSPSWSSQPPPSRLGWQCLLGDLGPWRPATSKRAWGKPCEGISEPFQRPGALAGPGGLNPAAGPPGTRGRQGQRGNCRIKPPPSNSRESLWEQTRAFLRVYLLLGATMIRRDTHGTTICMGRERFRAR